MPLPATTPRRPVWGRPTRDAGMTGRRRDNGTRPLVPSQYARAHIILNRRCILSGIFFLFSPSDSSPRALPNEPKLGPPSPNGLRDNQSPNSCPIWLKPVISETTGPRVPVSWAPRGERDELYLANRFPRSGFRNHRNRP
ncbi:hypothetical protein ACJJTC_002776 [Scirpophaga incertulas]